MRPAFYRHAFFCRPPLSLRAFFRLFAPSALLCALLSALLPLPSQAARLSLVAAANSSDSKSNGTDYSGVPAYGGGILLEFRSVPSLGFELGALYLPRRFESVSEVPLHNVVTVESKMYEFPLLLRAHLGHFLSLGFGGYYAVGSGQVNTTVQAGGFSSSQNTSYAKANQTDSDYGLASSLALTFRMAPLTYFLLDGRYTMGLKNNSTAAGGDRKFNDMQLLAGLQLGF